MNLYYISQTIETSYYFYDSAVVAAVCEYDARMIHPDGRTQWKSGQNLWKGQDWCHTPNDVIVSYLGTAAPGTMSGVICASYNAG